LIMEQRTHIRITTFSCDCGRQYRQAVKLVARTGTTNYEEFYRTMEPCAHNPHNRWLPIPKCPAPNCLLAGTEITNQSSLSAREFAQVPEHERMQVWLSPDGERVPVPGYRGAKMPERYRRAGYITFEAASLRDLDRIERIRAAQTGNAVYSEVGSFDGASRHAREQANYTDDMTVDV
jgi:hypothetical protein